MTKEEAIDKIKKLLRMKRGGTPSEVETALAMAAGLASRHGIDLSSVDPDQEPDGPIGHIDTVTSARLQWECKFSALICQSFFNVTALVRDLGGTGFRGGNRFFRLRGRYNYCITLIGTTWDTQIAIHVYHFLIRHFRHCWKTRRGRARNRHAFMRGMYYGICSKLDEERRQRVTGDGLVLIGRAVTRRRRRHYMEATFGKTNENRYNSGH